MPRKPKGRVGDAPLVGCGGYANEFGAAATSGHGEALMKMTLAREVVYDMEKLGLDAQVKSSYFFYFLRQSTFSLMAI
jgi:beta-aspartyl-peptidase (threonine type)